MSDPVEHQSTFADGHTDWRPGATCDECKTIYDRLQSRHGIAPFMNVGRMRDYEYNSVFEMEKQAVANARAAGIEPERAP